MGFFLLVCGFAGLEFFHSQDNIFLIPGRANLVIVLEEANELGEQADDNATAILDLGKIHKMREDVSYGGL